ncbi:uncharacterized protein LACBIDRAFT_294481 [Laccaria bicolor S238N-H82]|uniref:Predicted protein n=1 Tax=Laccaria bicolor (strain S238N-H82 / ATCC MYA-4686) TaxID=486041 RepID=B0DCD5_LACBS|nr:uncharacterized protein LACBIDRAFT_294481 [Laccaria bicolor S238N-H82]EDR07710.1 predicted protein [Laccaria bicolor S238N-H82]|eukprot:XP_001881499.1 predicted protein [Laccaria bicolor S238N-H82]
MSYLENAVMDDSAQHPADPLMIARLAQFPKGGAARKSLEDWLSGSTGQRWVGRVNVSKNLIQDGPPTTYDMDEVRVLLGTHGDIRKNLSSKGIEAELLKTLCGDPKEYHVQPCSDDSLVYLLSLKDIDLLIGMCHLSMHSTHVDSLKSSDITTAVKIDSYDSISPSQPLNSKAVRLDRYFKKMYTGPGVQWLKMALPRYMEMYNRDIHYGKTIVVLQSSGTGKSRTLAEMASSSFVVAHPYQNPQENWGISICFRGLGSKGTPVALDGYPLGDRSAFGCLDRLPKDVMMKLKFGCQGADAQQSEEIAAAFMGALFGVVHDTIMDAKRSSDKHKEAFDKSWGISEVAHQANAPRVKNFEKVRTNAIALLKEHTEEILDARRFAAPMVFITPDLQEPGGLGTATWVTKLFHILVTKSAETLDNDRRELELSCFTFTLDECNQMNFDHKPHPNKKDPDNRITLPAMQRVIKASEQFNFWFFMLDTINGLSDVYPDTPAKKVTSSFRLQSGPLKPLPPWIHMPLDVMVPSPENLPKTPLEALLLDHLRVYGRPLWSTFDDNEIVYEASRRLLCEEPQHFPSYNSDKSDLQVLAVHSTRFILNLTAEGAASRMAIDSANSHLRVLTDYNASTRRLKSEVLSEPILAIAAGDKLLKSKETYKKTMGILIERLLLDMKVISLGENGDLCGRMILIVNRDATVHAAGGQICVVDTVKHKIVQGHHNQGGYLRQEGHLRHAVRPFLLHSYLRQLVDQKELSQVDGAYDSGLKWASKVYMNFTHFVQLEDFIESELSYEFALLCWRRGLALQCVGSQPVIDKLLVGYRGDLSKPFDPKMFVFIVVHTKNRVSVARSDLINTITCPFLTSGSERWKPEYMVILMDLGTTPADYGDAVQVTKCKAVKGWQAWSAFNEIEEYPAVRINMRGLRPYLSLHEWAPQVLQLGSNRGSFAHANAAINVQPYQPARPVRQGQGQGHDLGLLSNWGSIAEADNERFRCCLSHNDDDNFLLNDDLFLPRVAPSTTSQMPPDPEANLNRGKSIRGTSLASAQAAAQQQVKSSNGNRGSTTNRSRSNQPDHANAQAGELVNPAKDEQTTGGDRAGSPKKPSTKSRSRTADSSSSLDIAGQAPVGTPIAAPSGAQAIGANPTARSSGAPAATGKASGETGDADATNREMVDLGKPTKPLNTYPPGCKSSTPVLSSSDPSVRLVKSSSASAQAERQKAQAAAAAEARDRAIAEAANTGEGGPDSTAPPGIVRSEDQDPLALPRRLPGLPNSRSSTLNSVPPSEGVESQEQDLGDAENVDYSDGDSNDDYGEDEDIYADARAISEKLATPGFKESLTQEEYDALRHHQFQQQQQEANRQMYMQQQQLLEVAEAIAPKPGSRSTTNMLGIGGSSDKPQSSKEKQLRRKILELEYAWQQEKTSHVNLDHHYRKLWNRGNALSEELQRSQHQVHRLLDDVRSLTHELEAVKSQLADAKTLSEVRGKELKGAQVFLTKADTLSTTDVVQKVNALNEEIFQAAALLGEMLRNTERPDRTQEEVTVAFEKAGWMVGEHMANILGAESVNLRTDLNPLLVQVVLQIAITTWCKFVVSSWRPSDSSVADFLAAIYSEIRQVEDQAVSGRWRSITRAQLRSSSDDWTGNLMGGLLSVLVIAGWSTRELDQQHQFERRLPPIFKAVQDLRKALGEDVTSMDMEVAVIDAGDPFNPTYMEDGYGDARASSGSGKKAPEKVSGTTGLGLHKISMRQTSKGPVAHSEMVLFPKVVLEGTVKEAMDPAPPPASKLRKKPKTDRPGNGGGGGGGGAPATGGTGAGDTRK